MSSYLGYWNVQPPKGGTFALLADPRTDTVTLPRSQWLETQLALSSMSAALTASKKREADLEKRLAEAFAKDVRVAEPKQAPGSADKAIENITRGWRPVV